MMMGISEDIIEVGLVKHQPICDNESNTADCNKQSGHDSSLEDIDAEKVHFEEVKYNGKLILKVVYVSSDMKYLQELYLLNTSRV